MGTSFVLGIDVGTSFTAAAIGRRRPDGSMDIEPLELGSRRTAVPTVVFLGDDGGVLVGEAAERRAIDHPERLVREFKRRIGDQTPIIVEELSVAPEDIFAILAQWVVERAEQHEGAAPGVIALSHPASWGEHRLQLIRAALTGVGLGGVELVSEPEAAGLHYLDRQKVDSGEAIAVYDLGGGTFDAAVLRMQDDAAFHLIGAPTGIEHLGGADFDQRIFEHVKSLAGDAFDDLDETKPDEALALARVRRDCVEAKEALSFDAETVVPVLLPRAQARVRLVRSEFDQMIAADLGRTVDTLRSAVTDARLELCDISTVLLIGGSSRIPAVAQLISAELELPVAIDSDPKASISLGAAVAASRRLAPVAIELPEDGSDPTLDVAADPLALAGVPVGAAASTTRGPSVGVRATVLAGVAAALIAVLIPVTPVAIGTQESPEDEAPGGSTADVGSIPAGRYVTGAAPLIEAPLDPVFQKEEDTDGTYASDEDALPMTSDRPLSPANGETGGSTGTSTEDAPSAPSSANDPAPDPTPNPEPSPDPDPAPDPVPDPVLEPEPEPEPVPDPTPEPDPVPSPAPDPAPGPTDPPVSEP